MATGSNTTGANAGTLAGSFSFSAVENWTGGKGNDSVVFSAGNIFTGTVNGGLGLDTLNFAAYSSSVTANNGGTIGSMSFAAMENWTGGTGNDTLTFSAGVGFSGTVNGGTGTDVLNLAAFSTAVTVSVTSNDAGRVTAPGVGYVFSSMESWTGGSGNDAGGRGSDILIGNGSANVLIGNAGRNILVGGAGNDRLIGGASRDILIGGAGDDVLNGGSDSDLLIGGTTSHDTTVAALASLMSEWARTDIGYAARINHLNGNVGGGNNGAILLDGSSVFNDAGADTLSGAAARDWFLTSLGDTVTDKKRTETKTTI